MNPTTTSWACQRCGATSTGERPWYQLCGQCLADLQALALHALPETGRCPSCGGPACPCCGDAMPLLVPVPVTGTSATGQLTGLLLGYFTDGPQGVTGNDG